MSTRRRRPPRRPGPPSVILWYRLYCVAMVLLYLAVGAFSVFALAADPAELGSDAAETKVMAAVMALVGFPLAVVFVLPFFAGQRRWAWVLGIVLIAIGMTSACCIFVCVPLLIFWLKDDVKAYFGRLEENTDWAD